ncbi:MAG TPA: hypothetical protein VMG34_02935 [Bacteroidota bacterium]|nr:hypothetical protein [Bacteroidota bacterium]
MRIIEDRTKFDFSFPRQVIVIFVVAAALASYPLAAYASRDVVKACIAGSLISLANALAGYAAIEYAIDKSYTVFLRTVLGGTGVRMFVMLAALLVLIKVFGFDAAALVVSLLGLYILFLILELMFIHTTMTTKAKG